MPKIINSNNSVTNVIETLPSGKDVDVYLCEELLNDMILGINVHEGGVPEKITSFNSSITQHFALPPMITEIQLIYYHTPINVDKMHQILKRRFEKIVRAFHGGTGESINEIDLNYLKEILSRPINYAASKYASEKTIKTEDICKLFIKVIRGAYKDDLNTLHIHNSRTFLVDKNYNLEKEPNTIVDIALNNMASEFYGFVIKYYNLFIVNMASFFSDEVVVDDNLKHLFITSIYNKVSLVVTTNRSRKVGQNKINSDTGDNDEYYDYEEIADFKKYIGIMPYGPYTYSIQNVADSIVSSKTFYSIGRFDDIFIPRNDGVPQSQQQLSKIIDPTPLTFNEFIEKCNKSKVNILRNIYQIHDYLIYIYNKVYKSTNNVPYSKSPVIGTNKYLKITGYGKEEPYQLNYIKSIFSVSMKQGMAAYIRDHSSTENFLIGVPFNKEDGTKTLNYHLMNNAVTKSFFEYTMPSDKNMIIEKLTKGEDAKTRYNAYILYFNNENNNVVENKTTVYINDTVIDSDTTVDVFENDDVEKIIKITIESNDTVISTKKIIFSKIEEEVEEGSKNIFASSSIEITGNFPNDSDFTNLVSLTKNNNKELLVSGNKYDIENLKISIVIPKASETSGITLTDSTKKLLDFFGINHDIKVKQEDLTKVLTDLDSMENESLVFVVDKSNNDTKIVTTSIYNKD